MTHHQQQFVYLQQAVSAVVFCCCCPTSLCTVVRQRPWCYVRPKRIKHAWRTVSRLCRAEPNRPLFVRRPISSTRPGFSSLPPFVSQSVRSTRRLAALWPLAASQHLLNAHLPRPPARPLLLLLPRDIMMRPAARWRRSSTAATTAMNNSVGTAQRFSPVVLISPSLLSVNRCRPSYTPTT